MKKKETVYVIIFICLSLLMITGLSRVLTDKTGRSRKYEFYNSETDFDALYFGASRIREAVDPIYIWTNYGISSYNMASAGESVQMSYYVLADALENCTPEVVFIDAAKISDEEDSINAGYGFVHESIDAIPINRIKLEAVDYAGRFFDGGKLAFLSMLYAYHDRYEDLDMDDFRFRPNANKGAYIMTSVVKGERPVHLTDDEKKLKGGDGVRYYERILKLCREKGVKCVLTDIPVNRSAYSESRQKHLNALIRLTREQGGYSIAFNEMTEELGLDYDHCFGDSGHLNFIGAEKVSDYLARYMREQLGIADHRDDPAYSVSWDRDVAEWSSRKVEKLVEKTDAVEYLFGAMDENRDITLYAKDTGKVYDQYAMDFCLEKLGIEPKEAGEDILAGYDMKIQVRDSESGEFLSEQFFKYNMLSGMFTAD